MRTFELRVYSLRTKEALNFTAYKESKDLDGKTIAMNGALTQFGVSVWLDKDQIDSTAVKFLDMAYGSMAPALVGKRVDAAILTEPGLDDALVSDVRTIAAPYDAIARDFLISAWFATTDYVKEKPDVIRRFASAMLETARWANRNHAESAAILEKYRRVPTHQLCCASSTANAQIPPSRNR